MPATNFLDDAPVFEVDMTTRIEIEQHLKKHHKLLNQKFKVKKIGIFGSYALGQTTEHNDIDILVEFYEAIGWEFVDLQEYLEKILGQKVDLVTVKALKPQLKDTILSQVIYV